MCVTVAALIDYQTGGESPDKDRLAENLIKRHARARPVT
jgi:hypothetical protein